MVEGSKYNCYFYQTTTSFCNTTQKSPSTVKPDLTGSPNWGESAYLALQTLLPEVVVSLLLLEVKRTRPLLKAFGLELQLTEVLT